ncbi:septal ring lytic transglycosylase RlpA family protein [Acidisoma cellulosilytica]|uniref:Endolytic peptidoglycan transglycosylase RlpA n=1 Tax=Acidisoma cellulosilyticum TaxID=2802395 RepID=A0A963YXK7_9PROT|nr:septal ring lytic transglycosylase RlpA family protein [Acidisoma cellulosilyticum]MCB8878785.1 septal ring lytic transglycosylase RlpA family protein [Acidisoma cellulosilyticum]
MKSRIALSIAPILMITFAHQAAQAATTHEKQVHHARTAATTHRHGKSRVAMTATRHNRHVTVHHLAMRHVHGHHVEVAHAVTDSDGWSPALADISYPSGSKPIGASVHLTSFTEPEDASTASASGVETAAIQTGVASYYGGRHNGRRTSSGQIFNEHAMTAAHATLPFGTKVLVKVPGTDRSVIVTITDRLFSHHRIIDLSEGAAEQLGIMREGLAMVTLTPTN